MAKTIRLTVAQALVKFLNNQYIKFDGKVTPMFEGIFGIFGRPRPRRPSPLPRTPPPPDARRAVCK